MPVTFRSHLVLSLSAGFSNTTAGLSHNTPGQFAGMTASTSNWAPEAAGSGDC